MLPSAVDSVCTSCLLQLHTAHDSVWLISTLALGVMVFYMLAMDFAVIFNGVLSYLIAWSVQGITSDAWRSVACIIAQYAMCIT